MFPEALLLRVQHTPGVQRCSGLINEFHGGHYQPESSGAASSEWGMGAHFFEFSCSVAWGHRGAVYQGFRGSALAKSPDFRVLPGRRKTADSTGSKEIQGGVAQEAYGMD